MVLGLLRRRVSEDGRSHPSPYALVVKSMIVFL